MDRDNLRERGAIEKCLCPCANWLNFCEPIETEADLQFLGFNPLPYDTRCGCCHAGAAFSASLDLSFASPPINFSTSLPIRFN